MDIIISTTSTVPLYQQICEQIKRQIVSEELPKGSILPSIRVLSKELKVSVITTKKAYDQLEAEKYINIYPGKGTYVSENTKEFLKDALLADIEQKLYDLIETARSIQINDVEFCEIVKQLYKID